MRTFLLVAVAAILGVLLVSQWSYLSSLTQKQRIIATSAFPIVSENAPPFDLPTITGERVRLADYEGRPVLLYFWTTWCGICKRELPILVDYSEGAEVPVSVISVCSGRSPEKAREIAAGLDVSFPVGYEDDRLVVESYQPQEEGLRRQITAFPFAVIIDADGKVVYALAGRFGSVEGLLDTLDRLELR